MPQRDLDVKTQETRKLFIEIYTLIEEARPRADTAAVTFQVVRGWSWRWRLLADNWQDPSHSEILYLYGCAKNSLRRPICQTQNPNYLGEEFYQVLGSSRPLDSRGIDDRIALSSLMGRPQLRIPDLPYVSRDAPDREHHAHVHARVAGLLGVAIQAFAIASGAYAWSAAGGSPGPLRMGLAAALITALVIDYGIRAQLKWPAA
jgi:hypothetical protein